jgi:hypothetical protein
VEVEKDAEMEMVVSADKLWIALECVYLVVIGLVLLHQVADASEESSAWKWPACGPQFHLQLLRQAIEWP